MYQPDDDITVFLCDSSEIVYQGLEHVLSAEPKIKLVGWTNQASRALAEIENLCPSVVILDLDLPGCCVHEMLTSLNNRQPHPRIILLKDPYSTTAITADVWRNVNSICSKCIQPQQIIRAIVAVASGAAWLDGEIARQAMQVLPRAQAAPGRPGWRLQPEPGTTNLSNSQLPL